MYSKEILSIKKSNRFRTKELFDENLIDLASNDYLGLSSNKELFKSAYDRVLQEKFHSPKASMLVNGYSKIHKEFEENLCNINKFEDATVVGSGFLANLAMIEALCRKNDTLFIDDDYHASGILATKLLKSEQVVVFEHNNHKDLEKKLKQNTRVGRNIIAIEGVYSMGGDLATFEIFDIAKKYESILLVDEAHSSGVVGKNLLGIFDYYEIMPNKYHIKMGTLGKAYGSYGAYILSSKQINDFLINRAKPIIYSTAPSQFDIALGNENLKYIQENKTILKNKIEKNLHIVENILNIKSQSLIIPVVFGDNKKVKDIQSILKSNGYLVGAIRQPTVKEAIIRLIAKIDIEEKDLTNVCNLLKEMKC